MPKKFPKTLYVKIEGDEGQEYFDPHQSVDTMVDAGDEATVAVYELREIVKARGSVTVVSTTPIKRGK